MADERSGRHIVILVHGIRSFGSWQDRFAALLAQEKPDAEVYIFKYGYVGALAFLIPVLRFITVLRFRRYLAQNASKWSDDRVDIIAHSFGAYVAAWALYGLKAEPPLKFDTVILCGSVLKQFFPWDRLVGAGLFIRRIENHCGTKDLWPVVAQLFALGMGISGRHGFAGVTGLHAGIVNRYFPVDHGGFFNDQFMKTNWVPLLTGAKTTSGDELIPPEHGWGVALESYADPLKLFLMLIPLIMLALVLYEEKWERQLELSEIQPLDLIARANQTLFQDPRQALVIGSQALIGSLAENTRNAANAVMQEAVDLLRLRKASGRALLNRVEPNWWGRASYVAYAGDHNHILLTSGGVEGPRDTSGEVYLLSSDSLELKKLDSIARSDARPPLEFVGFGASGRMIYSSRQDDIEMYSLNGDLEKKFPGGGGCTTSPIRVVDGLMSDAPIIYGNSNGEVYSIESVSGRCQSLRHGPRPVDKRFASARWSDAQSCCFRVGWR